MGRRRIAPPEVVTRRPSATYAESRPAGLEGDPPSNTEAAPGPQASSPTPEEIGIDRSIFVGVDFGTSSTKVVWHLTGADRYFEAIKWNSGQLGISGWLLPSTIVLRQDDICFGLSPEQCRPGDILLESIKLCVLCHSSPTICGCNGTFAKAGIIDWPDRGRYPAQALACLYLAHVFRRVENLLTERFKRDQLFLVWNVGCPMDHMDQARHKDEWERMTSLAMEIRHQVRESVSADVLAQVVEKLSTFQTTPEAERQHLVQPEGLAAVKAFLESPWAQSKTYAIVDVGAGTTEVSFFFHGHIMTEPDHPLRPSYLFDSTHPVGGVRIDRELAQVWGCSIAEAHQRKENRSDECPATQSVKEICRRYREGCAQIFKQKKLVAPHDKKFDLFVIGGAGSLPVLRDSLRDQQFPGGFLREKILNLEPPLELRDRSSIQGGYRFLANACGLASSASWEYYPPHETDEMTGGPPEKPQDPLDDPYAK